MPNLYFTIDSHLFRELGERLVGRPYIALAELVKNAYDADANNCEIFFLDDEIHVCDDGHGMTFEEFRDFWMKIGTTNKLSQQTSRHYKRALTGSKGIGRLAVQFLGKQVEIITTSSTQSSRRLKAEVDWDEAIDAGDLTKATARYELSDNQEDYANGSVTGTKIVLRALHHDWSYDENDRTTPVRELAREVWMLRPPFADAIEPDEDSHKNFHVTLLSQDERMEEAFRSQLNQVLEAWDARIEGEIRDGRRRCQCDIRIVFRDGDIYEITTPVIGSTIHQCEFEVRIFKLYGKQPGGIPVDEARGYFKEFGGVHVYDSAFRLPYYGIEQDWLGIQLDHSHRKSISRLLPSHLNVPLAMHDLPTMERVFGVVKINTSRELRKADRRAREQGEFLKINIGRDRLVDNAAYQELRRVVRWSIDYYATRFQLRQERDLSKLRPDEPPTDKLDRLWTTIKEVSEELPDQLHTKLVHEIEDYYEAVENENRYIEKQTALLAPLASAGMAALAFEHESNRQVRRLETLVGRLSRLALHDVTDDRELQDLCQTLASWIKQHKLVRRLFGALMSKEDREDLKHFRARETIEIVVRNTRPLLRKIAVETDHIEADLLLPLATMADWQGLFQNVFINASNAMIGASERRLRVSAASLGRQRACLRVSDSGVGVSLENSGELFEPFVRRLELPQEHQVLGLGGMGLGLTIVRMICESRRCRYEFVDPEPGFSTSFQLTWRK